MFNEVVATALAVELVKLYGGSMNYNKLINLMYLSDREILQRYNYRLTYDTYVSEKTGPRLTSVYECIKKHSDGSNTHYWSSFLITKGADVVLIGNQEELIVSLTDEEEYIIKRLAEKFKDFSATQLAEYILGLPEWNQRLPNSFEEDTLANCNLLINALQKDDSERAVINTYEKINAGFETAMN